MSELAKLTAAPNTSALPGHTINRFRIADFAACEGEFEQRHLATAVAAGEGMPKAVADRLLELANADVAGGKFNYGRTGFDAAALASRSLPFIVWVSLRKAEPTITREQAAALLTEENEDAVQGAVLTAMGFDLSAKKDVPAAGTTTAEQKAGQTGQESSAPSSKAE